MPPNVFTSRVMSTIITHCYPYPTGYMCLDLSSPHDACQKRKIKRNREKNFDSLHKSKYIKVKDRPFAEGSRGCHALFGCMPNLLVKRTSHYIAPYDRNLYYAVCCFYYFAITNSYNAQFSLTLNDPTHSEAIFIALLHL